MWLDQNLHRCIFYIGWSPDAFIPAKLAQGPHSSGEAFIVAQKVKVGSKHVKAALLGNLCFAAAGGFFLWALLELPGDDGLPVDEILQVDLPSMLLKICVAFLNFLKGKTFTVVMSADLLFRLMFELRKWFVLRGSENETFLKRCDTGLLLPMNPDKAEAMRAKLQPANEDVLSPETIHAITRENNESYMARLKEIEERVDLKKAQREQQALVTAAQHEAAASGTMRPTETE